MQVTAETLAPAKKPPRKLVSFSKIEKGHGKNKTNSILAGTISETRKEAADDAGLSERKAKQSIRCGELLKMIEKASGKRTDLQPSDGAGTRLDAAKDAGISKKQMVTAIRVSNVP